MPISESHNIDCMEFMKGIPDKFFELAIVDPPYGIGASKDLRGGTRHGKALAKSKSYGKKMWDNSSPENEYFLQLQRVSVNQIIWGANHFISKTAIDSPCWIVWDKDNGDNGYADCELAYTSFRTAVRKVKIRWHGMLQHDMSNKQERIHPTQKPIQLYNWLLKHYANPGDKILDTHMGSQSSRIAAFNMGFDYMGCELDKDYYEAGNKRFKQQTAQIGMF